MNNRIILKKYPALKIGFTTANFSKVLSHNSDNIKKLLDFAQEAGFHFIEIRDPQAVFSLTECHDLANYASKQQLEVIYAMGAGLLDENYWTVFSRGIANSSVFNGPKFVRTATTGTEMLNDAQKQYWTAQEFTKLIHTANKAANIAKMFGMQFSVENGREGLCGDGTDTFGLEQLFGSRGVNENTGLQLDVANFFCTSRVPSQPEAVRRFLAAQIEKITYTHIKTSQNHKSTPFLNGNELPLEIFFAALQQHGKHYAAIELNAAATTFDDVCANHLKSVEYLVSNY